MGRRRVEVTHWPDNIIAVPLRGEWCVHIANIPHDFTKAEATRVAAIIEAMVEPKDDTPPPSGEM